MTMLITREKFYQIEDELSEYIDNDRELYNVTKTIVETLGYRVPFIHAKSTNKEEK